MALGFGIATPADAGAVREAVNGVVVGAAFMRAIAVDPEHGAAARVVELGAALAQALRHGA